MKLRTYIPELIVVMYAALFLFTKNPSSEWDRVIVSDGKGYYAYLTALFIYHDTDYGFIDNYESEYYPASRQLYKDFRFDTGKGIVNKYFPGIAVLWLPFFGAGHAVAVLSDYPADGYSLPYQFAIAFAAFFYFWLALLILRKILRFYTKDENAIAWALLATGLATNLIYYTVNAGCQVHIYNFFLINGFIYSVLEAHKRGKPVFFALAAFFLGMIIISRPQNGLIVFALPFICGSFDSLLLFLKKIFTEIRFLLPAALALAIPLLIPVGYWYLKTGHFLVYSYGSESYNLCRPHLLLFLFSFEKGWMLYTPVAAFALLGFIHLFRKNKWQFFSLAGFLFFLVYFMSSWWVWTYTSYISQRVMIDYYAFIGILLVLIFSWVTESRKRFVLPILLTGFILLNLMQHFQQLNWIYPAGPVTAKAYFGNFFSFSKGTTFMIPENEILGKQSYSTDFESNNPHFSLNGFSFSQKEFSGTKALILDTTSLFKPLFVRWMSDFKENHPLILRIGGSYNPLSADSSLLLEVSVGTYKNKYSVAYHNLMPGLKTGKWKYAEMAVYLPYLRSVSDSVFISIRNLSQDKVLLDDLTVEFLKMKGPDHHDWIPDAPDPVDTVSIFSTDLESIPQAPWGHASTLSVGKAFSGKTALCLNTEFPYSIAFEKDLEQNIKSDGYFRVSSRINGDSLAEVLLVFDFTNNGKSVCYKTYPVKISGNPSKWNLSEIYREYPVARLNATKVKIYYWYTKGKNSVYIDDFQVDMVKFKPAKLTFFPAFALNKETESLYTTCCDFESPCKPESGFITEVAHACSGKKVCLIDARRPFSFSHLMPLTAIKNDHDMLVHVSANVNSDQYLTNATLVADFRQGGKSVSYNPDYLRGQTIKGEWNRIEFDFKVPANVTSADSVLVYFYLPESDEECQLDDFCVSLKKPKSTIKGK